MLVGVLLLCSSINIDNIGNVVHIIVCIYDTVQDIIDVCEMI